MRVSQVVLLSLITLLVSPADAGNIDRRNRNVSQKFTELAELLPNSEIGDCEVRIEKSGGNGTVWIEANGSRDYAIFLNEDTKYSENEGGIVVNAEDSSGYQSASRLTIHRTRDGGIADLRLEKWVRGFQWVWKKNYDRLCKR